METTTTQTQKPNSSTQWHAFLTGEATGIAQILTATSEKELKEKLSGLKDPFQILGIVRGKAFKVKEKKAFDFLDETETTLQ